MYIERVPNRNSPPAVLLRESYREGGRVRKRTLANLSHLPDATIEGLRRVLRGDTVVAANDAFSIERSRPHGHVAAVLGTLKKLGLDRLLAARRSPQRDRAVALIVFGATMMVGNCKYDRFGQIPTLGQPHSHLGMRETEHLLLSLN